MLLVDLQNRVRIALTTTIVNEWSLLSQAGGTSRPSERAVAFHLGWYLRPMVEESWDIDCEYNRSGMFLEESVRLVDDEGRDAREGELGEIHVKGNGLMGGYWGREADTAAAFRDGWFLTGDVARRDADGYVTILGRKSVDVIKSGGYKISAREIEDVLRRHPAVKDAAVVGLPDRVWGQRIAAAVVLIEPHDADAAKRACEEIAAFAASCLADFKKPRDLRAVTELPRNALGKVQKHLLVKSLGEGPA